MVTKAMLSESTNDVSVFYSMSLNGDPLNDTTLNDVKMLLNTYTVSFDFNLWVIPRFSANVCEKKRNQYRIIFSSVNHGYFTERWKSNEFAT